MRNAGARFLVFSLSDEQYCVPLLDVKEVIAVPEITPIPCMPAHFLGIINLRGQVISILDLRKKLGFKDAEMTNETAVIIVDLPPVLFGIVVDTVVKVIGLKDDQFSDPPDLLSVREGAYLKGVARIGSELILVLDTAKTLNVEDLTAVRNNSKPKAA